MQGSRTSSSPLARTDAPQEQRAADLARDPRHAHALALQRSAGNRATTRLISREVRTIQGEAVHVHSDAQARSAERIIKRIRRRYGIKIRSGELVKATKKRYSKAPASELMKVKKRHWHLRELRALEKACKHYAPILGANRDDSTRKDAGQEVKFFGKATHSVDTNAATGVADSSTLGEYYSADSTAGMYEIAENDTSFGADVDASLEWVCTHELSHGLMDYIEEDLRKAAGYWKDYSTKTGAGEEPWSGYAKTSLGEDLAESRDRVLHQAQGVQEEVPEALRGRRRGRQGVEAVARRRCGERGREQRRDRRPRRRRRGRRRRRDRGRRGCGRRGRAGRRLLSLPGAVEDARALVGSSRADVLARLGASEDAVARGVEYGRRDGLDEVETPTGRVVFDGDRVAVVYVAGRAAGASPDDLVTELGEGETLPGADKAGSELHVYPGAGLAFSQGAGPKLEMVEAFAAHDARGLPGHALPRARPVS